MAGFEVSARILVVDDSPTLQKVVSAILSRYGFSAVVARDGVEALEVLRSRAPFDLVLLDFVMPRMNGFQFCRALRAIPELAATPVVLMSAKGDKLRERFVEQTGALDAISKPFAASGLIAVVEGALARARAHGSSPAAKDDEEPLEVLDEASFVEVVERPSVLPGAVEHGALDEVVRFAVATLVPALRSLSESEMRDPVGLTAQLERALRAGPVESLWLAVRDVASERSQEVLSGDLGLVPLPEVIQVLQMQRQTGHLHAAHGGQSATLFLRDGHLELAKSVGARPQLLLGRQFVEAGLLSRAEVEAEVDKARAAGKRLGDHLVAEERISEQARRDALLRHTSEVVYDLVRWQSGRFWFTREPLPDESTAAALELGIAGLMLEGFRRVDEWRLMESRLDWDQAVVVDELARAEIEANITSADRRVLAFADGKRSIGQIVDACELARFDAVRAVFQLLSSRVLRKVVGG
jgi:CheY-like chemotaxis protein